MEGACEGSCKLGKRQDSPHESHELRGGKMPFNDRWAMHHLLWWLQIRPHEGSASAIPWLLFVGCNCGNWQILGQASWWGSKNLPNFDRRRKHHHGSQRTGNRNDPQQSYKCYLVPQEILIHYGRNIEILINDFAQLGNFFSDLEEEWLKKWIN